jgi:hypothetical protein
MSSALKWWDAHDHHLTVHLWLLLPHGRRRCHHWKTSLEKAIFLIHHRGMMATGKVHKHSLIPSD